MSMRTLICQQCCQELDPLKAIVEWMATHQGIHLCETIRLVHKSCVYAHSHPNTLELLVRNDHWLPWWELLNFLEIPQEVQWDDSKMAMAIFNDYINHKNKLTKEVQK